MLIDEALIFACSAHASIGQTRKYTGEPYIVHPIDVMMIVREHGGTEAMQCAALLHDVAEDTPVTLSEIYTTFGSEIRDLVGWLTDNETGNRAERKAASCERLSRAPAEAQTIKLADLISNTRTIVARDPKFADVYLKEKATLLNVMTKGSRALRSMAWDMIPAELRP